MWDRWAGKYTAAPLLACCIITTEANGVVSPVHNRMQVIMTPEGVAAWLDLTAPKDKLNSLLTLAYDDLLESVAVSRLVNSPKNDGPECVEPDSQELSD